MTWARTSSESNRLMVEIDVLAVYRGFLTMGIGASPVFPDPRKPPVPPSRRPDLPSRTAADASLRSS